MKVAHIVPPNWIGTFPPSDYILTLAGWILADSKYADRLRRRRHDAHIILDNGAFEGNRLTIDGLNKALEALSPSEIVLPDALGNPKETLIRSWKALTQLAANNVMFVPQGATIEQWSSCLHSWLTQWGSSYRNAEEVLSIGITALRRQDGKLSSGGSKAAQIREVAGLSLPMHLLGLPDVKSFAETDLEVILSSGVRGIDTSICFALGAHGVLLTVNAKKIPLGNIGQYERLSASRRRLVQLNMLILEDWINTGDPVHGIPCSLIRLCASRYLQYWAEGLVPLEKVMIHCGIPAGRYALTRYHKREQSVRPLGKLGRPKRDEVVVAVSNKSWEAV